MRGATDRRGQRQLPDVISIRAPLVGSDNAEAEPVVLYKDFNPRSPCGERPAPAVVAARLGVISIRAPLAGSDRKFGSGCDGSAISIRAPLAGSDDT